MHFEIILEPIALMDIQEAIDYYDDQKFGLGEIFENEVNRSLLSLSDIPYYQIRYDKTRCLPLKKFPYMIHYTLDEEKNG